MVGGRYLEHFLSSDCWESSEKFLLVILSVDYIIVFYLY